MRIISGQFKGRRIAAPKNLPVRPTTDMAKEALFNILRTRYNFSSLKVLDLFAGTGNISYEFASRGVNDITAVDSHSGCVRFIDKTATELEMPVQVYKADVFKFLERANEVYDIIFADPPYELKQDVFDQLVSSIKQNSLLSKDGMLVIEHDRNTEFSEHPDFIEARKYGGCFYSFFS